MKKGLLILTLAFLALVPAGYGQHELLHAGPMVGYSEMREVQLWVQTRESAEVHFQYWNTISPERRLRSAAEVTRAEDAFTAKITLSPLDPGQKYEYRLFIDGTLADLPYRTVFQTLPLWRWRGDPPSFRFAAGSCAYINEPEYDRPGTPYGAEYEIFGAIHDQAPDFMLWLGDNVYFREPDWNSRTGALHRYTHDRALPEMQPMLGSMHHYAIWDDHDYGPNNSDRGYWMKNVTLEIFGLFWANPSFGTEEMPGAITYFNWNDADFFLLDNRFYRSPNDLQGENKTILGVKQRQWLMDNLVSSRATFKFVVMGGQFLNDVHMHETYQNYGFSAERREIIDFIHAHRVTGVIFISGDRHFSELSRMESEAGPVIYDLTLSPLTAGPYTRGDQEENSYRVPGKVYVGRNFGLLEVSGARREREVHIRVLDPAGREVWTHTISEKEWPRE